MTWFIFYLTLRQLFWRKSTLLLILLAVIPVVVAVGFRLSENQEDPAHWTANVLLAPLIITATLPLTALLFGVSSFGDELEEGTGVYLLTKPLERQELLVPKLLAPWMLTCAFVFVSTVVAGAVALGGLSSLVWGFAVATLVGALAYSAVFVLLSVVTSRALIAGLLYIFLWEGVLTGIFEGLRYMSIRYYILGVAEGMANAPTDTFNAYIDGGTGLILLAVVTSVAGYMANRHLQGVEIREAA